MNNEIVFNQTHGRDGFYDERGSWRRSRFCFVSCQERCTCTPPNGEWHITPDLIECPFCGETPKVSNDGSCLAIDCCISMGLQKCDILTIEQRDTWNSVTFRYSDEAEEMCLRHISVKWNTRHAKT